MFVVGRPDKDLHSEFLFLAVRMWVERTQDKRTYFDGGGRWE